MRLLFIRHAESEENFFMESLVTKFPKGLPSDYKLMDELMKAGSRDDGDAPLTALGLEQAEKLGAFYAPLLAQKALDGKLQIFVSPQRRTCLTAAPLVSRLHQAAGIRAQTRVELHETGPPTHRDNLPFQQQGTALRVELNKRVLAGELTMAEVDLQVEAKLHSFKDKWVPTGMSATAMR